MKAMCPNYRIERSMVKGKCPICNRPYDDSN
jgi:hypothetical protein